MKRCITSIVTLILALPALAAEVTITHLGNEGFLVEGGAKKVLVDALHGEGIRGYVALPAEQRDLLETARPPFDGADLVLATHHHGDHFDARSVARYLEHAPDALFVSTGQAVRRIRPASDRARGHDPPEGEHRRLEHAGIELTVMNLHHGRGRDVSNLGFVFEVGGTRFFHVGDTMATPEELTRYGVGEMGIDVAMLPSWFLASEKWPAYEKAIAAEHVIAMHIPEKDAPPNYFGPVAEDHAGYLEWLRRERPKARLFWEPLQEMRLE